MNDSCCKACGHERAFHRRSNMVDPAPCSAQRLPHGADCGCRAAFEVDAQGDTLDAVSAAIVAMLLDSEGHRSIRVEHLPELAGPPWRLSLWEARSNIPTDSHRHVGEGIGFTFEEALRALEDAGEPVKQQKQSDNSTPDQRLSVARRRLQRWIDADPENRAVYRVCRRPIPDDEGGPWWVVRVIAFAGVGEPDADQEAASRSLAEAIERALDLIGAEKEGDDAHA